MEGKPFSEQLQEAMGKIDGRIEASGLDELEDDTDLKAIPADPEVKNYSYTVVEGEVYYREDSVMKPVELSESKKNRRNFPEAMMPLQKSLG